METLRSEIQPLDDLDKAYIFAFNGTYKIRGKYQGKPAKEQNIPFAFSLRLFSVNAYMDMKPEAQRAVHDKSLCFFS